MSTNGPGNFLVKSLGNYRTAVTVTVNYNERLTTGYTLAVAEKKEKEWEQLAIKARQLKADEEERQGRVNLEQLYQRKGKLCFGYPKW